MAIEGETGVTLPPAKERPGAYTSWKRRGKILPQSLSRERGPANTTISDLWPQQVWKNKFLLFQAVQYIVILQQPRKLMQKASQKYHVSRPRQRMGGHSAGEGETRQMFEYELPKHAWEAFYFNGLSHSDKQGVHTDLEWCSWPGETLVPSVREYFP